MDVIEHRNRQRSRTRRAARGGEKKRRKKRRENNMRREEAGRAVKRKKNVLPFRQESRGGEHKKREGAPRSWQVARRASALLRQQDLALGTSFKAAKGV